MLESSPNKLRGHCGCGADVYPQEGHWVSKLKQIWCKDCWAKETARLAAVDQKKAATAELAPHLRPKVRLYWNALQKRVIARTLERVSQTMFKTFESCCESAGCAYDSGPGGMGYNGPIGIVPELTRILEKSGLRVEVSDALADALNARAAETRGAVAGAGVRIVASAKRGLSLRDYQKIGVEFLVARPSALLADDPGLGKTAQMLKAIKRAVVIAPKLVVGSVTKAGKAVGGWAAEAARWRPDLKIVVLRKQSEFRWPEPGEIIILNYELMPVAPDEVAKIAAKAAKKRRDAIAKGLDPTDPATEKSLATKRLRIATEPPKGVDLVIDEAHQALANPNNKRAIRFKHMSFRVLANEGHVYAMTATPLKNEPKELWNILESIGAAQTAFGSFQNYAKLHDYKPKQVGKDKVVWEFGDPTPEVAERLKRVMIRRRKRDVLKELPPLTVRRLLIDVDPEAIKACDAALSTIEKAGLDIEKAMELVEDSRSGLDFTMISKALDALARVKAPYAIERALEYERTGTPVVFMASHLAICEALGKRKGWGMLVGGGRATANLTGEPQLMKGPEVAELFQAGKLDHVCATIQYAGAGVNLHRASELFLVEKLWSPYANTQAVGRIERLGQENPMTVTDLVADHPLDHRMSEVLERKIDLYSATVDAASVAPEDLAKREDVAGDFAEAARRRTKGGK